MNLGEHLTPEQIVPEMKSNGASEAIRELVDHLYEHHLLATPPREEVLDLLFQREAQVSTGVGSGVAIPHAFVGNLERVVTAFGRSSEGINFASLDNAPVFFVVLFIVPQAQYQLHLRALAAIAKMFANSEIRKELRSAITREDILAILSRRPPRT